jgi:hypothetical protein
MNFAEKKEMNKMFIFLRAKFINILTWYQPTNNMSEYFDWPWMMSLSAKHQCNE